MHTRRAIKTKHGHRSPCDTRCTCRKGFTSSPHESLIKIVRYQKLYTANHNHFPPSTSCFQIRPTQSYTLVTIPVAHKMGVPNVSVMHLMILNVFLYNLLPIYGKKVDQITLGVVLVQGGSTFPPIIHLLLQRTNDSRHYVTAHNKHSLCSEDD